MKAQLSERQKNNDKRMSAINVPVNSVTEYIHTEGKQNKRRGILKNIPLTKQMTPSKRTEVSRRS